MRSFELQVLLSNIIEITNTPNNGILCHGGERWWEELGVTEAEVAKTLIGNRDMNVRDIRTTGLLVPIKVVFSVVQHIVLPRSGNTYVMSEMDHMVMFCRMTRRSINLVRLILDFIISAISAERRRHATLPYGMFFTKVFIKAQLLLDSERCDKKRPTTTMKTFLALGLKAKDKKKEMESKKKKDDSAAAAAAVVIQIKTF